MDFLSLECDYWRVFYPAKVIKLLLFRLKVEQIIQQLSRRLSYQLHVQLPLLDIQRIVDYNLTWWLLIVAPPLKVGKKVGYKFICWRIPRIQNYLLSNLDRRKGL